jgi:hypothetical protein
MSKRKSSRKVAVVAPEWSDLEETFFAAAPPDDPERGLKAVDDFDELMGAPPRRSPPIPAWLRRALAESRRLLATDHRLWVVLATLLVLVGLSAAVFH